VADDDDKRRSPHARISSHTQEWLSPRGGRAIYNFTSAPAAFSRDAPAYA
jgi:hypothetical protein